MQLMLRGRATTLAPLDSVRALRPGTVVPPTSTLAAFKAVADLSLDDDGLPISLVARRVFFAAGWQFVKLPADSPDRRLVRIGRSGAAHPVFLDPDGRTLVGTPTMVLELPERLTVREVRSRLREDGLAYVERLRFGENLYVARLAAGTPLDEAVAKVQENPGYVFAEPVFLQVIIGRGETPDPGFGFQWQHDNSNPAVGTKGCDIKSLAAWKTTRGAGVRIAVIDNGMQIDHPDLAAGIDSAATIRTDPKGNVSVVPFVPGSAFPDSPHGTFCMGMAGARRDNGLGGCGSAPEAKMIALACAPDQVGTQLSLAKAVSYAAKECRADIISCSLGAEDGKWKMESVLDRAITEAAEQGRNNGGTPIFWAVADVRTAIELDEVCSHPLVTAVGHSGPNDIRELKCAYGPKLEFLAPGVGVYSTTSGSSYGYDTGASFACPLAAGVAALVVSRFPHLTREEIVQRLRETCDQVGGPTVEYPNGRNDDYGYGRINADRAVHDP